jgi:hypothetical protein
MGTRTTLTLALGLATLAACTSDPVAPPAEKTLGISFDKAHKAHKAHKGVVVVTEDDVSRQAEDTPPLRSWVLYTRLAGNGTFRDGPGSPPQGTGSFEFVTPTSADKAQLFNFDYVGTTLADITALGYHTYQSAAAVPIQLPAINLTVDFNGPGEAGGFTTLVFEPVYNVAQGPVVPGIWQDWDALSGGNAIWWSTRSFGTVCATVCYVTWDMILAQAPHATILGGVGLNQGTGSPALTASVDAFTVGVSGSSIIYDFELSCKGKGHHKQGKGHKPCKDKD